ncbi:uncharacterized protein [Primulina eburnea]|uniref:uncharacterized protein n=1 Tax=Primulina eburnea TaxID=1245227 RepID=UPI003C6C816D
MRMYIKSIEERAWQRVLDGWSPPKTVDDDGDSRVKPESSWSNDEVQTSNFNSKALNALFTSVDVNMFSLITNCISAKEAWDILQKHCEGSESVRRTKLEMLTSKFESFRMEENETIVEYDRRLLDIANVAFSLGDPMSNERLVSKVLRSLPERFNIKICAIDESKDTSTLNLEDLISSLRTFEMNLDLHKRNKGKTIALQSTDDSMNSLIQEANESDLGEESILSITKKFGDYLKRMRDKKKTMPTPKPSLVLFERNKMYAPTQGNFRSKNEVLGRPEVKKLDSVQCRECSGFGYYANECSNRLRRNKNKAASLSDEDTDEERDSKEGDDWKDSRRPQCFVKGAEDYADPLTVNPLMKTAKFKAGVWYFDSGCSRHMTGSKEHLTDYVEVKSGRVTYGGGGKERIVGKGIMNVDGLPELHNVLHVEGLNSNLISISKLCHNDLHVRFNKNNCEVFNDANVCVMSCNVPYF